MKTEPDNLEEVKSAHARGEIIQFREKGAPRQEWHVYGEPFTWYEGYDFRIAPKPENTPWRIMPDGPETQQNCISVLHIVDKDGNLVARMTECTHAQADALRRAYAAHIVRCVNALPAAIAALEDLLRQVDGWQEDGFVVLKHDPDTLVNKARAALAALREGR